MDFLTREQLYKLVWSRPVSRIADELGISGVALKKKCIQAEVPTPARGHWRQLERTGAVHIEVLPVSEGYTKLTTVRVAPEQAMLIDLMPMPIPNVVIQIRDQAGVQEISTYSSPKVENMPEPFHSHRNESKSDSISFHMKSIGAADPEKIFQLVARHEDIVRAKQWLLTFGRSCKSEDPATRAVEILWIARAEEILAEADPIHSVLTACREIAMGKVEPAWWRSLQVKSFRG